MVTMTKGRFEMERTDGVSFVYRTHSPNGTECHRLTAHDDYWASVYVGRFPTLLEAAQAANAFVMPPRGS